MNELYQALAMFKSRLTTSQIGSSPSHQRDISRTRDEASGLFMDLKSSIERSDLVCSQKQIQWLQNGRLWPAVTPVTLLEKTHHRPQGAPSTNRTAATVPTRRSPQGLSMCHSLAGLRQARISSARIMALTDPYRRRPESQSPLCKAE